MDTDTTSSIQTVHGPQHINQISLSLHSLPLRPSTLAHLLRCGFASIGDVSYALKMSTSSSDENTSKSSNDASPNNLATELDCTPPKAAEYTHEINDALTSIGLPKITTLNKPSYIGPTAASILKSKRNNSSIQTRQIVSFCRPLDELIGGGLPLSELTEIVGLPGSGKTQLAMQLAVDARLPARQGGVEGCTVVIDGEGSWCAGIERLYNMAQCLVDHVGASARNRAKNAERQNAADAEGLIPEWFTPDSIMEGIHIFRVHDEISQGSTLYSLPKFLLDQEEKGRPVKLLVIDSLAFHYRAAASKVRGKNRNNSLSNTYNLARMAAFLSELATEFEIAVVAMNHMTTRIDKKDTSGSSSKLVPALGESWAHSVTSRLIIDYCRDVSNVEGLRSCRLVKSPHKPPGTALFAIADKGIRGVPAHLLEGRQEKRARVEE